MIWSCRSFEYRAVDETGVHCGRRITSAWEQYVKDFTRRSLAVSTDRRLALLGIGSALAKRTGDTFDTGFFLSALPFQLLWSRPVFSLPSLAKKAVPLSRPKELSSMPSWSWISVLGEVDFQFYPEDRDTVESLSTLKPIVEGRLEMKGYMITGLKIGPAFQLAYLQSLRMIQPSGHNICRLWNIPHVHMEQRVWPMRRLGDKEIVGLALPDVDTDFENPVTFFILF